MVQPIHIWEMEMWRFDCPSYQLLSVIFAFVAFTDSWLHSISGYVALNGEFDPRPTSASKHPSPIQLETCIKPTKDILNLNHGTRRSVCPPDRPKPSAMFAYSFSAAGYPNTTGFRKVVKATILVKKKPGMSDADFIQHYNHKHAQMAAPVLERHNIISYTLVRTTDHLPC
jgi:hypothetical protein